MERHEGDVQVQGQEIIEERLEIAVILVQGSAARVQETTTNTTIVHLPMYMREANKGLFEPRVVAIGPYHHGHESTIDMEAHKERFFHGFFERLGNSVNQQDLTAECTNGALQCYSGNVGRLYTTEKLMRDGCFIIELLLQWKEGDGAHLDSHMRLMSNSIYYDLLLVENQIPFMVLDKIFEKFRRHNSKHPIFKDTWLVNLIKFFNQDGQFSWAYTNLSEEDLSNAKQVRHLLEIQYNLVIRKNNRNNNNEQKHDSIPCLCGNICRKVKPTPLGIPGANELQDYGVKFHVKENHQQNTDMFDVTFSSKTMAIPRFKINFGSKILLANLFAYDQIVSQPAGNNNCVSVGPVTSYVVLMNALINTKDDVVVLQREGILDNLLSNEEEVATFFNKLGRCALVDVSHHRYTAMFEDVNRVFLAHANDED
ncbi:UPF0481 protein At3g47200-like [Oryza brachyantha]|uniref:UPF0481 protein At3g47200-like n=1 Tax=Oryza brachyantha TaxID=4533 RepID=UPI0003EA8DDE|nr:UPF0481 protein At3g47200-like [Oryza brachyantha]